MKHSKCVLWKKFIVTLLQSKRWVRSGLCFENNTHYPLINHLQLPASFERTQTDAMKWILHAPTFCFVRTALNNLFHDTSFMTILKPLKHFSENHNVSWFPMIVRDKFSDPSQFVSWFKFWSSDVTATHYLLHLICFQTEFENERSLQLRIVSTCESLKSTERQARKLNFETTNSTIFLVKSRNTFSDISRRTK